jgi:hypothetical protein
MEHWGGGGEEIRAADRQLSREGVGLLAPERGGEEMGCSAWPIDVLGRV